jgi:hypothetical protein
VDQEPESTSVTGGRAQVDVFEGVVPDADLAPRAVARPVLAASFCAACRAMSMQRRLGTLKYRKPYGIHFKLRAQCRVENAEQSDISLVLRVSNKNDIEKGKWLAYAKRLCRQRFRAAIYIR